MAVRSILPKGDPRLYPMRMRDLRRFGFADARFPAITHPQPELES